jgi:hypothetical protein
MARLLVRLANVKSSSCAAARAAHAYTRFLTVDAPNRNAPVDEELLVSLSREAIKSALNSFRGGRVTLVATSVTLQWVGIESVDPPPDCFPRLEEQLDQFFGDRSGDGWIRRWTNKDRACYDDYLGKENASRMIGGRDYTNFSE